MERRGSAAMAGVVLGVVLLTGCSASASDVHAAASDALAAARSSELGIRVAGSGRSFPTTERVLLENMATQLGNTITQLEQLQTASAVAERDRVRALRAARDAVDAIHRAQAGHPIEAEKELRHASKILQRLAGDQ